MKKKAIRFLKRNLEQIEVMFGMFYALFTITIAAVSVKSAIVLMICGTIALSLLTTYEDYYSTKKWLRNTLYLDIELFLIIIDFLILINAYQIGESSKGLMLIFTLLAIGNGKLLMDEV